MKKKIFAAICSVTMMAGAAASVPALDVFSGSDAIVAEAVTTYGGWYNGIYWEYVEDYGGYRITKCYNSKYDGTHVQYLTVPAQVGSPAKPVVSIDSNVFVNDSASNAQYIKTLSMPNTVFNFGSNNFKNCTALQSITFSNTLITIGSYVCYGASSLTNINVPASVRQIGTDFCGQTPNLQNATFENGVQIIGDYAFWYSTAMQNMTLPNSVRQIGSHFCYGATNLRNVNIGSGLETMGNYSFYNCDKIQNLNCNSTKIETLGRYTLNKYKANQTVILGGNYLLRYKGTATSYTNTSIKAVAPYAFNNTTAKTVYLPYCKFMNDCAFANSFGTKVYLSASLMYSIYGSNYANIIGSRVSPATIVWLH